MNTCLGHILSWRAIWNGIVLICLVFLSHAVQADSVTSPTACSSYFDKARINELRIGNSGKSSSSNQIEIYNISGIDASVWQTWQLLIYAKDSRGRITKKGGYFLSSGFTANGAFIFNNSKNLYLRNRNARAMDIALLDRYGYLIDYIAIEGKIQSQPTCFGTARVVDSTVSRNTSGNISRATDGGAWPAAVNNTSSHTIGRTNVCTLTGKDLSVSNSVDISAPMLNETTVSYVISVLNKSCSTSISDIALTVDRLSTSNFSSLSRSATVGTTASSSSATTWNVGTLAAGAGASLTVTGKPKVLGDITTTAAITAPSSGLVNLADDSDAETINVRDYNYVGFEASSATLTEGEDAEYSVLIRSNVAASKPIVVRYTVSGSAGSGDTNLAATGSVTIDPDDEDEPTETSIDFSITNDATHEADKNIILSITSVTSADSTVKLNSSAQEMTLALIDDDPAFIAPGGFNAFETTTVAGAISGVVKTKIAGQAFNLDLVAIDTAGSSVLTSFSGDVTVELVNAAAAGSCAGYPSIGSVGAINFAAADNGRHRISLTNSEAWPNLRLRIKYPATGTASIIACSTDNFAIRPASLVGIAQDASWTTAGTSRTLNAVGTTATPIHKAGRPFTLIATAHNSAGAITSGYSGTPSLSLNSCVLPATGCVAGILTSGAFSGGSGTLSTSTASYSEAGAITAILSDTGFAAVDAADGSSVAERSVTSAPFNIGRFVPDHFDISANTPAFVPACGSFTYLGQPFGLATPPIWNVTARNSEGATTQNYTGSLFKLAAGSVSGQTWTSSSGSLTAVGSLPAVTVSDLGSGVGSLAFGVGDAASGGGLKFARTALMTPFNASLTLSASVADSEGVVYAGNPYLHAGIGFDGGQAEQRFGRLRLSNAQGSERLALPLPLTAQYWNGQGFVTNSADNCTALAAPSLTYFSQSADNQLAAGETTASLNAVFSGGNGNLRLTAPGEGNHGYLDLSFTAPDWLKYNWDGIDQAGDGMLFDDNPRARAAFGKRGGSDKVIIRREIY